MDNALEDGVTLDATPNSPGETICWHGDDAVTVTFGWRFPTGQENVNAVQGDEVEFDFSFRCYTVLIGLRRRTDLGNTRVIHGLLKPSRVQVGPVRDTTTQYSLPKVVCLTHRNTSG